MSTKATAGAWPWALRRSRASAASWPWRAIVKLKGLWIAKDLAGDTPSTREAKRLRSVLLLGARGAKTAA